MLRTLLIFAIFIPGFIAALTSPYAAALLYLWFALFRPQDWVWIDITSLRLSLVLGVLFIIPALARGTRPDVTHPLGLGCAVFFGAALAAQTNAVAPAIGWQWIDFLGRLLLISLLLIPLLVNAQRLVLAMAVIAGSLGFHAGKAGLASLLGGGMRFGDGLAGAFVDNNGYALGVVMIMPLLLAVSQNMDLATDGAWGRFHVWIARGFRWAIPFCAFAVVSTYSRGGFLSLAGAMLFFIILQRRRLPALTGLGVIVILVLTVVPIPQDYVDRLQTIRTYDEIGEESAQSRPHFWRVGILMAADHPLGIGLRQYEKAYDRYDFGYGRYGRSRSVHSSHIQVLAEIGYIGMAAWCWLFVVAFVLMLRVRSRSRDPLRTPRERDFLFTVSNALLTSMTGFLIGGSFLSLALNDLTWLTFALVAGLDRLSRQVGFLGAPVVEAQAEVIVEQPALSMAPAGPAEWLPRL
jgi:probable O-glycosylation ligase (exosortase A-associated)